MPTAQDFRAELQRMLADANRNAQTYLDVDARDLRNRLSTSPDASGEEMQQVCAAMKDESQSRDVVLEAPGGQNSPLFIRYALPRTSDFRDPAEAEYKLAKQLPKTWNPLVFGNAAQIGSVLVAVLGLLFVS